MKVYSQPMTKVLSMMVAGSVCEPPAVVSFKTPQTDDAPLF